MNSQFFKLPNALVQNTGVKMLVYGGAGTGKTRMSASTAPRPLFVAVENGMLSIQDLQIPVWDCRGNLNAFAQFIEFAQKSPDMNNFDTIIIDSFSELATLTLNTEMPKHRDGRMAYGAMAEQMLKWANILVSLKQNVIFICKQECVVNNNITYHQPSLEGKKLYSEFTHLIDVILRFQPKRFVVNGKSQEFMVASVKNQPDYIARDRSGKLADDEPQDFTAIINKIKNINPQQKG